MIASAQADFNTHVNVISAFSFIKNKNLKADSVSEESVTSEM
jgi:hypothetical protein